jgi:hypothetical protein
VNVADQVGQASLGDAMGDAMCDANGAFGSVPMITQWATGPTCWRGNNGPPPGSRSSLLAARSSPTRHHGGRRPLQPAIRLS